MGSHSPLLPLLQCMQYQCVPQPLTTPSITVVYAVPVCPPATHHSFHYCTVCSTSVSPSHSPLLPLLQCMQYQCVSQPLTTPPITSVYAVSVCPPATHHTTHYYSVC